MRILNITATKSKLGLQDLQIGSGHIIQERSGKSNKYHKLNIQADMGLLCNLEIEKIPDDYLYLYFSGFYEDGDGAEGVYKQVEYEIDKLAEAQDYTDYGAQISNGKKVWVRIIDDNYVRPEWFGAKGDGKTNDYKAIVQALNYGYVEFVENKEYYCYIQEEQYVAIAQQLEILGNNAKVIFNTLYNNIQLHLEAELGEAELRIKYLNIETNNNNLFKVTGTINVNATYCNVNPILFRNFNIIDCVTQEDAQVMKPLKYSGKLYTNEIPILDEHPVTKISSKFYSATDDPTLVKLHNDQTWESLKQFTKPLKGVPAVNDNEVVTLAQLKQSYRIPPQAQTDMLNWLKTLKNASDICLYPIGATYIQIGNITPNTLWPGTQWVRNDISEKIYTQQYVNVILPVENNGQLTTDKKYRNLSDNYWHYTDCKNLFNKTHDTNWTKTKNSYWFQGSFQVGAGSINLGYQNYNGNVTIQGPFSRELNYLAPETKVVSFANSGVTAPVSVKIYGPCVLTETRNPEIFLGNTGNDQKTLDLREQTIPGLNRLTHVLECAIWTRYA